MGNKNSSIVDVKLYNESDFTVLTQLNNERHGKTTVL